MISAALITAGGVGTRMGAGRPKQYLELAGIPVIVRTFIAFDSHPQVDRVVVTVPYGDEENCRQTLEMHCSISKPLSVVIGGATRQASVFEGLKRLEDTDLVAIHDGVRPFVTAETITESIVAAQRVGAALACSPVRDTVKRRNGTVLETISREDLWLAHTPQTFQTSLIIRAHREALQDGFTGTDDASLVERLGHPVEIIEDSQDNIKITTPDDITRALRILGSLNEEQPAQTGR
jgi:2-C-methyl-D-erythritol 4-phosphate cytidylyltransferase